MSEFKKVTDSTTGKVFYEFENFRLYLPEETGDIFKIGKRIATSHKGLYYEHGFAAGTSQELHDLSTLLVCYLRERAGIPPLGA